MILAVGREENDTVMADVKMDIKDDFLNTKL